MDVNLFLVKLNMCLNFYTQLITKDNTFKMDFLFRTNSIQTSGGIPDSDFLEGLQTYYLDDYHNNPLELGTNLYLDMMESYNGSLLYLVKHYFNARGCFCIINVK